MILKQRYNQKWQCVIAGLTLLADVLLLIFMISVEGEPGALPLTLIVLSTGWLIKTNQAYMKRRP